ncbi:MAG: hypothetical protein IT425_04715 [Pirellulales bacterium]|nr:hypothetical protein [Pirellulales bacterium]
MRIEIPQSEQQRLAMHAAEAGFDNVEQFVTDHIRSLAQQTLGTEHPRLTPGELAASLALVDKSMAEFNAGGGLGLEEARRRTRERFEQLSR